MIDRLLRLRFGVVVAYVLVVGGALWAASGLTIDPNNRVFFGEGHEHYSDLLELEAQFGSNTNLFFVLASSQSLVDSAELSNAVSWLTDSLWRIPQVVSVDSIATYPHVSASGDDLMVDNLLAFVCPNPTGCRNDRLDAGQQPPFSTLPLEQ